MIRFSLLNRRHDKSRTLRQRHTRRPWRCTLAARLSLEQLEDRRLLTIIVPATFADTNAPFTPVSVGAANSYTASGLTLRDAVIEANYLFNSVNTGVANTIILKAGTYTLSIANMAGHDALSKTGDLNVNGNLTIQGAATSGGPKTTIQQKAVDRVFEVNSTGLTVNFDNLTIAGGTAVDDAVAGHSPGAYIAEGGGVWTTGDTLELFNVIFKGDRALGGAGTAGAVNGQIAQGGAIWDSGGTLGLANVTFLGNRAVGGAGLNGTTAAPNGGNGGEADGGGLYATGTVAGIGSGPGTANFTGNQALGGNGGNGANGATTGGNGGHGMGGFGGGIYAGSITLHGGSISSNLAQGGAGGKGGNGATLGGSGGVSGDALAGAMFASGGPASLTQVNVSSNTALTLAGGVGGAGTGASGNGGPGGSAGTIGGGALCLFIEQGPQALTSDTIASNLAQGGVGGAGGAGGTPASAARAAQALKSLAASCTIPMPRLPSPMATYLPTGPWAAVAVPAERREAAALAALAATSKEAPMGLPRNAHRQRDHRQRQPGPRRQRRQRRGRRRR